MNPRRRGVGRGFAPRGRGGSRGRGLGRGRGATMNLENVQCYSCQQYGHLARDCGNSHQRMSHQELVNLARSVAQVNANATPLGPPPSRRAAASGAALSEN